MEETGQQEAQEMVWHGEGERTSPPDPLPDAGLTGRELGNVGVEEVGGEEAGSLPHPDPLPGGEGASATGGEEASATGGEEASAIGGKEGEGEIARLRAELGVAVSRALESHRRALLAENAGRVVPELVVGATVEELDVSLETARRAFEAAKAAALAEISSTPVPAGNPIRQGPNLESMSPLEKIAYGLRRE